jgi:hypothetical protein
MKTVRAILWGAILVGFLAALVPIAARWQAETRNRSVEITVDFAEVRTLALAERKSEAEVLQSLQKSGVVSIALPEETLSQLEDAREIAVVPVGAFTPQVPGQSTPEAFAVRTANAQRIRQIQDAIGIKTGIRAQSESGSQIVLIPGSYPAVRSIGIGLNPQTVQTIKQAGLSVVGRVANYNGVESAGIVWDLNELKKQGVKTTIFLGDEMLGYKGYLLDDPERPEERSTASALRDSDLWLGIIEFSKQKGEAALAKGAEDRVVRVHTVTGAEMLTADVPTNVQRFTLAARERNIRLLYVRLFTDEKNPLAFNTKYIEKIKEGLERGGLTIGTAHGYQPLTVPLWTKGLIGLGIAATWLLLMESITGFIGQKERVLTGIAVGGALLLLGLPLLGSSGVKFAAFVSACLYPSLALLYRDILHKGDSKNRVGEAILRFTVICGITGLGIAAIVGLLADRLYLIKADAFIGIKGAQLVPLLLATLVYSLGLRATPERSFLQALHETGVMFRRMASQPVLIWQVAVALVALFVLALLVLRSGNDPGVGVSPLELKIRALLDQLLYARPRFKEFLVGHPALLLSLLLAAMGKRGWAIALLPVGIIGQVSLLNTFCHLHTPLLVSVWRAVLGVGIGLAIGFILYVLVERFFQQEKSATNVVEAEA